MFSDEQFTAFFSWQTILFCLGVYIITYIIRTIVEALWKGAKTNHYWNELALPLGPIATGILLGLLAKQFPWPMPITESLSAKAFYGAVCGICSGWVYARLRAALRIKAASVLGKPDAATEAEVEASMPKAEETAPPTEAPKPATTEVKP